MTRAIGLSIALVFFAQILSAQPRIYTDTIRFIDYMEKLIRAEAGLDNEEKVDLSLEEVFLDARIGETDSIRALTKKYKQLDDEGYVDLSQQSIQLYRCFLHLSASFKQLRLKAIDITNCEGGTVPVREWSGEVRGYMVGGCTFLNARSKSTFKCFSLFRMKNRTWNSINQHFKKQDRGFIDCLNLGQEHCH